MVNDFIDWILEEMATRDWSQAEMERRTGLSATMISHLISGKRQPGDATLRALVRADLKTGTPPRQPGG